MAGSEIVRILKANCAALAGDRVYVPLAGDSGGVSEASVRLAASPGEEIGRVSLSGLEGFGEQAQPLFSWPKKRTDGTLRF